MHLKLYIFTLSFAIIYGFNPSPYINLPMTEPQDEHYPFKIYDTDNFVISAEIEGELYPTYFDFFEKHGYSGNGYCWEGHIIQILEKKDSSLLSHINFDPEAGGFYAYADSEESRRKFLEILCPIFSDLNLLNKFVVAADRSRIDD